MTYTLTTATGTETFEHEGDARAALRALLLERHGLKRVPSGARYESGGTDRCIRAVCRNPRGEGSYDLEEGAS